MLRVLAALVPVVALATPAVAAAPPPATVNHSYQARSAQTTAYWTADRIASARPAPVPAGSVRSTPAAGGAEYGMPQNGPADQGSAHTTQGTVQRYTTPGFLKRVNGKVYFTSAGQNYQCSGSAVNSADRDIVVTAAHCVYSNNAFVTNLVFIPEFEDNVRPWGTWTATEAHITRFSAQPQPDLAYDYAVFEVAAQNGRQLGDVVGGLGWAVNSAKSYAGTTFGYPADSVNQGRYLVSCSDTTYENSRDPRTIGLACDMYGGTSGGPWIRQDPGNTYINGVNSFSYTSDSSQEYSPYFTNDFRNLITNADAD
ncbi:trypsin-like peptidase domain-containing protein [Kribbella sp. NBC_01505]|uniref:trypsin-like serine peptidase n=1 Tax=Kribbella sp. NBC_01505 TaxID=2903580 RepID=UPI00386CF1B4